MTPVEQAAQARPDWVSDQHVHDDGRVCWLNGQSGVWYTERPRADVRPICAVPADPGALDRVRAEAGAAALRAAAADIYNGAGDPEQALHDYGAAPWLRDRADRIEAEADR